MDYEFTLIFKLPENQTDPESLIEQLGQAGCDDALIGSGMPGRLAFNFNRPAENAEQAIQSAIFDIQSVIPDATLIEAAPDFVGLTDVADLLGLSRQNMRKLMLNHPTFPDAVHTDRASLWHLAPLLDWLQDKGRYPIPVQTREIAQTTMRLNIAREMQRLAQ